MAKNTAAITIALLKSTFYPPIFLLDSDVLWI